MAETLTTTAKPAEELLSKRRKALITDPLNDDNPVTVQVLGICSSLAVTTKMEPTLVMAIAVTVVVAMSNLAISLLRNLIPNRIRIIVQLAVVASLVIVVDQVLKAYFYDVSKLLSVFVGLIITNCIVMGRLEAYAMANKPYDSVLDGVGNGLGYAWIILLISFIREVLGSGSIFNFKIFEAIGITNFPTNGLMTSPVGAFFILGIIIWVQRYKNNYSEHA
ncbi:MAG: NADH:ubiquinone reductase (Na(+)-transporting) subunit D [Bacteroidetes bacterium]|nr:MAG: NADH:ubiquinone reductase (Na(+)-transporting) subunit D [Bacteroidota bacterium]